MAIKIKITLNVPEYNAQGQLLNTNVIPGGPATGEADTGSGAQSAIAAILSARQTSSQAQADLLAQIAAALGS